MKLRESDAQNYRVLKDIGQFLAMDQTQLIKKIENDLMRNNTNSDILLDIINALIGSIKGLIRPVKASILKYPVLPLGNSFSDYYILSVQQTLCKDGWLCSKMDELSHLTVEEQIDYLSHTIHKQEVLGRHRYTVSSLATATLIIKIGIEEFCGCTKQL
ncbi:MAG: hypothetical protein H0X31_01080 [Nostocaceae cyanobacterium]|nr:hypothetical protein [Nostocaceae cyanobacterium]